MGSFNEGRLQYILLSLSLSLSVGGVSAGGQVSQQIRCRQRRCWFSGSGGKTQMFSLPARPLDGCEKYKRPISLTHIVGNGPSGGPCQTIGKRILVRHVPLNCLGLASTWFDNALLTFQLKKWSRIPKNLYRQPCHTQRHDRLKREHVLIRSPTEPCYAER